MLFHIKDLYVLTYSEKTRTITTKNSTGPQYVILDMGLDLKLTYTVYVNF